MYTHSAPFYRFQGWRLIALFVVFTLYTLWYTGPGPFGQLSGLAPGMPLQEKGFYSGQYAVEVLSQLDHHGRATKYWALLLDIPYMVLQALVFESLIAFGICHMRLRAQSWQLLFMLPIGFLLVDLIEDSLLALTLSTGSTFIGTLAGFMTALKFIVFIPAILVSVIMLIGGVIAYARAKKQTQ